MFICYTMQNFARCFERALAASGAGGIVAALHSFAGRESLSKLV